jgi:hypothetical protein
VLLKTFAGLNQDKFYMGASPLRGDRAFRSKSSDLLMQILWAFRYNPLRAPSG